MERRHSDGVDLDTILGIVMIVLGVLVYLGEFAVGWVLPVLGVILVLMGILMLLGVLGGGLLIGLLTLGAGLALYLGYLDLPSVVTRSLNIVIGIGLVVLGILQMT